MFTFKKYALVGVAALAALSMSCSDDTDDEISYEFDRESVPTLGSPSNPDIGSSANLDANPVGIHKIGELPNVKNEIDLVYDGGNLCSPKGITTTKPTSSLGSAFTGVDNGVLFFDAQGATNADDLVEAMWVAQPESKGGDGGGFLDACLSAGEGRIFGVITNTTNLALVKVNKTDATAQTITLYVGLAE